MDHNMDSGEEGGDHKKQPSFLTIFNIANTMIGTSTIVLPLVFQSSGVITNLVIMTFVGWVSFKTCDLLAIHFKRSDKDVADGVLRILGRKWYLGFIWSSIALLFLVVIIYFILMVNAFWSFTTGIAIRFFNHGPFPDRKHLVFDEYSYQWLSVILICLMFITFSMKDPRMFLKLNGLGTVALIGFVFFVVGLGTRNMISKEITFDEHKAVPGEVFWVNLFTWDVTKVCGVFALGFMIHNSLYPILRHNREFEHNSRDTAIGYFFTWLAYFLIGIFGYWAIFCGKDDICHENKDAQTILDFYDPTNFVVLTIDFILGFHIFTVIPILEYVTRTQFLDVIMGNPTPPGPASFLSNVVIAIICLAFAVFNVDPTIVISFNGAVCGYFLLYIIPIAMHMKVLNEGSEGVTPMLSMDTVEEGGNPPMNGKYHETPGSTVSKEEYETLFDKEAHEQRQFPNALRLIGFGIMILYGLFVFVIQFIDIIKMFTKKDDDKLFVSLFTN